MGEKCEWKDSELQVMSYHVGLCPRFVSYSEQKTMDYLRVRGTLVKKLIEMRK